MPVAIESSHDRARRRSHNLSHPLPAEYLRAARTLAQRTDFRAAKFQHVESSAQMVMLGPLVVAELLWIQLLRLGWLRSLRTNIIAVL